MYNQRKKTIYIHYIVRIVSAEYKLLPAILEASYSKYDLYVSACNIT